MTELTSKEIAHLRGQAQRIKASGAVGKAGLTDAAIATVARLLDLHELVKITIPAGPSQDRQDMAHAVSAATDAALIAVVGRTVVLYKPKTDC